MSVTAEIKLNRANKIYVENEVVKGSIEIFSSSETRHEGISITVEGAANLQLGNKNAGLFDTFSSSTKPVQLLNLNIPLAVPGKISQGTTDIPFEFPLQCTKEQKILYETYHGVFMSIVYVIKCDIKRSFLAKSIQKVQQFIIQYKPAKRIPNKEVNFSISPETLQKTAKERISIPRFLITGRLETIDCCLTKPLNGHLTIQHTEVAIKSIELQLVRVETCGCADGYSRDATEIQTLQIAEGNVCPKLQIPILMTFPRLFTCPTLISKNFKVEFEMNLIVIFQDDYVVTENFQIILHRFE